jgi:hypothetical protein
MSDQNSLLFKVRVATGLASTALILSACGQGSNPAQAAYPSSISTSTPLKTASRRSATPRLYVFNLGGSSKQANISMFSGGKLSFLRSIPLGTTSHQAETVAGDNQGPTSRQRPRGILC